MLTSKSTEFPLEKRKEWKKKKGGKNVGKKNPTMTRNRTGELSRGVPKAFS